MAHFNDLHIRQYPHPEKLVYRGRWVHNWFSNFDRVGEPVVFRQWSTYCLEQAFVAAKNPDQLVASAQDDEKLISFAERAMTTNNPSAVKRLGSSRAGIVNLREDWDYVNVAAMDSFLRQRWQPQGADIERLLNHPRPITEITNWGDNRWGFTLSDCQGRNALGLLLEMICIDIEEGVFTAGAGEREWVTRQDYLVNRMNDMVHGVIVGIQADPIHSTTKFA